MEFTGKIKSLAKDLVTGKWNLQVELNENAQEAMELIKHEKLDIRLKQHRDKRSLDANAYYWVLLTKLAKVHGWANSEAHNRMLRRYGQMERVDGNLIAVYLPDTKETERDVLNKVEYHLSPLRKTTVTKRGEIKRIYILLRGSSTYDTEEMAHLISGLIQDCRDSGIPDSEIMTPFEKQKLFEQYGIGDENEQKNKSVAV
nr:hypothetical protein [uncultured Blautia sp.]